MRIEITTPPSEEPLLLAEAKIFCRVDADITDEDTLIASLTTLAREQIEIETSRALAPQTVKLTLDRFPYQDCALQLPRFPLIEVLTVEYDDEDNVTQQLTEFLVDASGIPGSIYREDSWPCVSDKPGSVRITYRCGHSADGADSELLPQRAKQAIMFLTNHYYERRDPVIVGTISAELPIGITRLVQPLKVHFKSPEETWP